MSNGYTKHQQVVKNYTHIIHSAQNFSIYDIVSTYNKTHSHNLRKMFARTKSRTETISLSFFTTNVTGVY